MSLDNHDSMLHEMASIHAIMRQKGSYEKRYTEKCHNYHNYTENQMPIACYVAHIVLLP